LILSIFGVKRVIFLGRVPKFHFGTGIKIIALSPLYMLQPAKKQNKNNRLTPSGRATIAALKMNNPTAANARKRWSVPAGIRRIYKISGDYL
jgi:hypothetical protein